MKRILITGATGNVGIEVVSVLKNLNAQLDIYAGARDTESGNEKLSDLNVKKIKFDFINIETFLPALKDIDVLFLLRPPQISDVKQFLHHLLK